MFKIKNMKKSLLLLLIIAVMQAGAVMAQPGGHGGPGSHKMNPEEMARKRTDRITQELNLNKTESDKVYQIELDRAKAVEQQMQAQKQEGNGKPDFSAIKKLNEERDTKLKALLGEERFNKIKAKEQEMRQNEPPKQQ